MTNMVMTENKKMVNNTITSSQYPLAIICNVLRFGVAADTVEPEYFNELVYAAGVTAGFISKDEDGIHHLYIDPKDVYKIHGESNLDIFAAVIVFHLRDYYGYEADGKNEERLMNKLLNTLEGLTEAGSMYMDCMTETDVRYN